MSNRASARLALVASLIPAPALAQGPGQWGGGISNPCLPFEPENSIEWPADAAYGDPQGFGRLVLAELDGDAAPEGIVLAGGVAVVLWKVAVHDAPEPIEFPTAAPPDSVVDLATLPGTGPIQVGPGATDAVVMTDERGLFLVTYEDEDFPDPTVLAGGAWVNAGPLHVDDLDGDGEPDVLALSADKRSILRFFPGSGLEAAPIAMPLAMLDVVAVDWFGDGSRELVALTARGLAVLDPTSGNQLAAIGHLSSTGCIARFRAADAAGGELLAWTRAAGGGGSELVVVQQGLHEGPWPLTFDLCSASLSIQPLALLAGDYDGDVNDELVLVHETNLTAVVLANLGEEEPGLPPVPHFEPSSTSAFDVVSLASNPLVPGNVGVPAFAQLDGDGPEDLVFPVATSERVEVFVSLPYYRAIQGGPYDSADIVEDETEFWPGADLDPSGILRFAFYVPIKYRSHTHMDLVLWRQPDSSAPVEEPAMGNRRHLLFQPNDNHHQWVEVVPRFPNGDCWDQSGKDYYYTEYRFAKVDSTGATLALSPIFAGGFTLRDCDLSTSYGHLITRGIPGSEFDLRQDNGLTSGGALPREVIGLYVPMSSVPYFEDGGNPDEGPQSPGPEATPYGDQDPDD